MSYAWPDGKTDRQTEGREGSATRSLSHLHMQTGIGDLQFSSKSRLLVRILPDYPGLYANSSFLTDPNLIQQTGSNSQMEGPNLA
jgi:hypothetical protein